MISFTPSTFGCRIFAGIMILMILCCPVFLRAQDEFGIKNSERYQAEKVPGFLRSFQQAGGLVFAFRLRPANDAAQRSDYFLLTRKDTTLTAYRHIGSSGETLNLGLSEDQLELVWKTFLQNDLLNMRDEKDIPNFCAEKYKVFNSLTYEFLIILGGRMKKLAFTEPEYYDTACYGMDERRKIINSAEAIFYIQRP